MSCKTCMPERSEPTPTLTCVLSLAELVRAHTDLDADDVAWLQLLQADWQIIADLSFADLVLWLPARDGSGYWAGAQMRPTTAITRWPRRTGMVSARTGTSSRHSGSPSRTSRASA